MSVKLNNKGELLSATGYAAVVNGVVRFDSAANSPESAATLAHGENVKVVRVTVKPYTKRSLDANALLHVWVAELSKITGEDELRMKNIIKIQHGLPVLMQNQEVAPVLKHILKRAGWRQLTWDQQIKVINLVAVTSIMSVQEMRVMMDRIKNWARNEFQIELPDGKQAGEMQQ